MPGRKAGKKGEKSSLEKGKKENILERLKDMQRRYRRLPEDKIRELSRKIDVPVTEIYSTASFYSMFSFEKKGRKTIRICNSPSCYLNGSLNIIEEAKRILGIKEGETTKDKRFSLELTSCIGCCDKGPAIMIDDELITDVTKEKLKRLLKY
ncbi:NAD(P)H-dependent oxidoreductase subunit E [Candidatus Woesearchaeota archaeon]|nr:NAD(P)H-dependent oxidoreductase subunit E [Candidatus Woesearchaeota archaeon]